MGEREHARDVESDVPDPDHDGAIDGEVELELLVVGMAVVPGDELGGRPRAGQVLAGDAEPAVALGSDRVDDGVVQAHEVVVVEVATDLDVAEEAEAGLVGDPLEGTRHGLQFRVIRRNPEPHEPPRRRQALDHVHLDRRIRGQQRTGGIEARRA